MATKLSRVTGLLLCTLTFGVADVAIAQSIERVGTRALGMGGAFVAVATDSTATWWNPAALAAGPFLDISASGVVTDQDGPEVLFRARDWGVAASVPPIGFSYYRFGITDIRPVDTIGEGGELRENGRAGIPSRHASRSLAASQLGVTLVHTLFS